MSGPILAVVGDVHAHLARLDRVLDRVAAARVDAVLLVGDLGGGRLRRRNRADPAVVEPYRQGVEEVLHRTRSLGVPVWWVPGNHDLPELGRGPDAEVLPGNIEDRRVEVGGLRLTGIGGAGPARFGFCYEWSEEDIDNRTLFAADLLLCHCPPNGVLDRTNSGEQVGSMALRRIACAHHGVYVCGHIHEAGGVGRLGDCLLLNAGGLGAPFGAAQVGFVHGLVGVRWEHLDRGEADEAERQPTVGDPAPVRVDLGQPLRGRSGRMRCL